MNRPRETGGDFFCVGVVESTCSLVLNWRVGFFEMILKGSVMAKIDLVKESLNTL